jgi:hypothetical protein
MRYNRNWRIKKNGQNALYLRRVAPHPVDLQGQVAAIQAHRFPAVVLLLVRLRPQHAELIVLPHKEHQRAVRPALCHAPSIGIIAKTVQNLTVQADRRHPQEVGEGEDVGISAFRPAQHASVLVVRLHPAQDGLHRVQVLRVVEVVRPAL